MSWGCASSYRGRAEGAAVQETQYRNYADILAACRKLGKVRIAVAAAHDQDILSAVRAARDEGIAEAVLVGDRPRIEVLAKKTGLEFLEIVHEPDEAGAAAVAAALVREGRADALMKGLVNTSDFLRAVLEPESGLRGGSLLSHLAAFEIPGRDRLEFHTDGGINIAPDLVEKKTILLNALGALVRVGVRAPKVAILSANEQVNPRMPSTMDARALVEMWDRGLIPAGILEGPVALDVAVSRRAAEHKGIRSRISGEVDLFLMPNIEAGNILGKALVYYAKAKMAGLVLGAACPIVLTSRSETAEGKLHSIALASLVALSPAL
ncbi:MAG TPA: bifunctional enoyl-CoA hydratase/phosphate acetyltransferase [Magnetospirillaceae bacterium]|nr:bifunctional enoyl-CoA hydratase/phosphate acetyltransferase [Magnetospirillaceae bacterium]